MIKTEFENLIHFKTYIKKLDLKKKHKNYKLFEKSTQRLYDTIFTGFKFPAPHIVMMINFLRHPKNWLLTLRLFFLERKRLF